ncbi:MAG: filamentous hemagglutinin N-terminal domain-containing protein [Akkermansiaceae bacterium]|nr:filamentous hemagglutinin N-terminal domain-containing protein [Akkermansiaceae bacterium]
MRRCLFWLSAFFALSAIPDAPANPMGGVVTNGAATISESGSTLTVNQSTQKAIIEWDAFSIGTGEVTSFAQPAGGAALNRVVTANPSEIFGQLNATGSLILINPNGILVGAGGQVDTAGFIASTLDVADAEFLAGGDLRFSGGSDKGVTNLGSIVARDGDLFLLGASVTNGGSLSAPNGTVGLAAGSRILVTATGDERVFVEVGSGGKVEHSGEIRAAIAELKAAGTDPNVIAVNVGGLIEATGVQRSGGKIFLNGGGGRVQITAPVEAKPAPESNPVSGTVIEIGGGDIDIRDTHVQAFGPGDADIALDAARDVTITDATVGPVDATGGSLTATAGRDFKLIGLHGLSLFGGTSRTGVPVDTVIDITAGRNVVVSSASTGQAGIGNAGGGGVPVGRPNVSAGGNISVIYPAPPPHAGGGSGGNIVIIGGGSNGGGGSWSPPVFIGGNLGGGSLTSTSLGASRPKVQTESEAVAGSAVMSANDSGAGRTVSASNPLDREMSRRTGRASAPDSSPQDRDENRISNASGGDGAPVNSGAKNGSASPGGADASQIRRLFDPMGRRQFIETRIGGQ